MIKNSMKKLSGIVMLLFLVFGSVATAPLSVNAAAPNGDFDANAVMWGGVKDLNELKAGYRYNQNHNVQAIYKPFGINSEADLNGMVAGRVTKSGEVWVGNKKVATNAISAGRQNMPGSLKIPGVDAYARATSVSFGSDSLDALVKMKDDKFQFAVIKACGNPVNAKPVTPPKKPAPKPQPKPVPKPRPQPQPQPQPQPTPEQPQFEVEKDVRVKGQTAWQLDETTAKPGETVEFRITVKNTGDVDLQNVMLRDTLPAGVSFTNTVDSHLFNEGINLGAIAKGASSETIFEVTAGQTLACETGLINEARAKPDNATEKKNEARLKICQPQVAAAQTTRAEGGPTELIRAGAGGALGLFSVSSVLGVALYKLKDFYAAILR